MDKHLIAVDLDGTLLTEQKSISLRTKKTLKKAMEKGHDVVISTGRPYRASKAYYHELGLKTPIVNFNGAYVHHPQAPLWGIRHTPLELQTAKTIFEVCEDYNLQNIMVEIIDDVYVKKRDSDTLRLFESGHPIADTAICETLKVSPTCLLLQPEAEHLKPLIRDLEETHADVIHQRSWGGPLNIIEIVNPSINKAVGLSQIADHLGYKPEQIIAFGDEDNDIEMLQYAGQGIAMGNAADEIKDIASDVTKTNEEDGIAVYLEKVLDI